jgi:hypothetical protein
MTRRVVHFEVEVGYDCLYQPACENAAGRDAIADIGRKVEMTPDEREVTCRKCLTALGYQLPTAEVLNLEPKELPNGRFQVAA